MLSSAGAQLDSPPWCPLLQAGAGLRPPHRRLVVLKSGDRRTPARGGAGYRERSSARFHSKWG